MYVTENGMYLVRVTQRRYSARRKVAVVVGLLAGLWFLVIYLLRGALHTLAGLW